MNAAWAVRGAVTVAFSAVLCAALIVILRPALQRYALVKPNARSSHREPTPQGGGIAVIAATIVSVWLGLFGLGAPMMAPPATVLAAVLLMACIGALDDIHSLAVIPRLLLQALAVAAVLYALPDDLRVVAFMPWWLERLLLFIGGLWFVNLVNFMDGIDWMTVVEVVPLAGALAVIGAGGALPAYGAIVALALAGAMAGFSYFNRPVAKLFLGDVGSLPIGLLLGWLLVLLAGHGDLAAALLLPLYYLADATITLLRRLLKHERIWQAHRAHFYQRAADRGFTVNAIVARVFAVNLGLAVLALDTVIIGGLAVNIAALLAGSALVGWLLYAFAYGRR
jgi:UDP-N-acetylmuramyl pentapeptide phosphotransferase/UDP-N-acetylglucosamine-1-phosphate transferase